VLAEMYNMQSLREWLAGGGIDGGSVCAACEFGLVPEGVKRGVILERCVSVAQQGLGQDQLGDLLGVGVHVVRELVQASVNREGGCWWSVVVDVILFVERWLRANIIKFEGSDFDECVLIILDLDLLRLPLTVFREVVGKSVLVSSERLADLYEDRYERRVTELDSAFQVQYGISRVYGDQFLSSNLRQIAVHGEGSVQRLAVADSLVNSVLMFNVDSWECVATLNISFPRHP
jgi:hypothetical protein